ncbi:hypothetical protein BJ875DRAFT_455330 [Amylocarpus encephaloides]|uniref:Uncharacterized protein n=1 Tax=Amylocarpus encephaloides TaxID=45428 RepID=A0A9P7YNK9_9HELO|nr:hypothetical protein BJ875DRAFT_455330 [Amylocarpus encephaloides]
MSSQSPMSDFEVAELEKEVPPQLEVEKLEPEASKVAEKKSDAKPDRLPPPVANIPDDYSDVPTPESPKQKRKYQRGGRKQRQQSDLEAQSEAQLLEEQAREEFERTEGRGKPELPNLKHRNSSSRKDTGIKTFNLKKTEESGPRPFGITLERPDSESKKVKTTKTKNKVKPKNKSKPKVRCDKCGRKSKKETEENWESGGSSGEDESEEEEKEQPKQKPFAIRLDLNLELEIFLRAKIKGDVTITFLQ